VVLGALVVVAAVVLGAPFVAPYAGTEQFADRTYAPPTRIHFRDDHGFRGPFIYRQVLEDRLLRTYREDRTTTIPIAFFRNGRLISVPAGEGPLLLFGADSLGRDVFSRVIHGAQLSLGVTLAGVLAALIVGALVGGLAGTIGGRVDAALMLVADFVLVLPGAYLVLVLRSTLPDVLSTGETFALIAAFFAVAAWPHVARGVRAIVAAERTREYAVAARAAGAGPFRLLGHFLPATRGFLGVEIVLLVPALLVAEATVSYLGLGFVDPHPSWGTLLPEAASVNALREAPWILAPAAAIFVVTLLVQLAGRWRPRPVEH
jgi:peptide/nickel transport system permease protein